MDLTTGHEPASGHPDVRVVMVRENLDDIPSYELPSDYSLRWYRPGDGEDWQRIHDACGGYGELDKDLFRREFGFDDEELGRRMCFACTPDGTPVSTNTAWFGSLENVNYGRIHWVATSVSEQRKGLSGPLMTAVCVRMKELGHDRAYLTTNTLRLRAILLYHRFGFKPYSDSTQEKDAWGAVEEKLRTFGKTLSLEL